jgi:predicted DNA repair protein MutK
MASVISAIPGIGGLLEAVAPTLLNALVGIVAGAVTLAVVTVSQHAFRIFKEQF